MLYYVLKICTVYMQADEPKIWAELHENVFSPVEKRA